MAIDIENVIDYYVNLLITQYNQLEKARATIDLQVRTLLDNDIYSQVQDGYNLETAVGVQLDVLGQYIGIDRNVSSEQINPAANLFGVIAPDSPISGPLYGVVDNTQFGTIDAHILGAEGDDYITTSQLNDDDYRFILQLRVLQNNINHSEKEINEAVFAKFGTNLVPSSLPGSMAMSYLVNQSILDLTLKAVQKGVLPRPMAVRLQYLIKVPPSGKFFGFANDDGTVNNNITGFDQDGKFLDQSDLIGLT